MMELNILLSAYRWRDDGHRGNPLSHGGAYRPGQMPNEAWGRRRVKVMFSFPGCGTSTFLILWCHQNVFGVIFLWVKFLVPRVPENSEISTRPWCLPCWHGQRLRISQRYIDGQSPMFSTPQAWALSPPYTDFFCIGCFFFLTTWYTEEINSFLSYYFPAYLLLKL